ncbi:hypothetical protein DP939_01815 [Spongiactinospora rosea]|uniref:Uncharacterized protein n=1 Tax=Spongiactinospora rosea TaxID=2248750 RepID=A0A366M6N2_9ACTN|nr:hypothetical protein [Spongiactinospora rosea]RBQ21473.1 hypothetical protein DP939_01815 [Spongiactinospora rosea]
MASSIRSARADDAPRLAVLLDRLGYPADAAEVTARLKNWLDDRYSRLLVTEMGAWSPGSPPCTPSR